MGGAQTIRLFIRIIAVQMTDTNDSPVRPFLAYNLIAIAPANQPGG